MPRTIATAKCEGYYLCERPQKSDDFPYRAKSTTAPNQNQLDHGGCIGSVRRNINTELFAGNSTLEEPNPREYEPVGSDPDVSECGSEPEYDLEESEFGSEESEYKLEELNRRSPTRNSTSRMSL